MESRESIKAIQPDAASEKGTHHIRHKKKAVQAFGLVECKESVI